MPVKKKTELEQLIQDIHTHHINYHTREIYLHSAYTGQWDDSGEGEAGVEFKMATTFVKNLNVLTGQSLDPVLVHMHCIGGEWSDGMAMFNAMRFTPVPVTMIAYAQASSMSGILLQAADYRILTPDCEFMIHHGSLHISANSTAAKSAIDVNERLCKRMLDIFTRRARNGQFFIDRGYNDSRIRAYIDRKIKDKSDWHMTAEEALHFGFCDAILGEDGADVYDNLRVTEKYEGKL